MGKLKNVLLVYPEVPRNTYWSFSYALKFIRKKSAMPPLGLITVASLFPEKYNLKLIDMNIEPLSDTDILWADTVFISAMIVQKDSLQDVATRCNRLNKPVVAGGPYPTSSHQEISGVDHFVLGEVDDTFQDVLSDLDNDTAKDLYPSPERPDISNSVTPRFDLLKIDAYSSMAVQFSRGCPFKCEFCDIWKVYGNKPRLKSPETLITEFDMLHDLGWRGPVFIVDDNFIGNKRRVKKDLLPALINWQKKHDYDFRFFTEASINLADDNDLMNGMRNAGFNEVFIGIETPCVESLKETGKTPNLKIDLKNAIQTIQQHGMEVMAGFILGFDSDAEDIFDRQIAFIQQTGIPKAMVGLLNALPATELYNRLSRENRILCESVGNNTHSMSTNFITKMDSTKLKEGYKRVLATIYDSNLKNYFSRCSAFMDNLGYSPYFQRKVGSAEIRMLFKSIFRQTFTIYGHQYLRFVIRNLIKNPNLFGEAIKFAIIGHHYHTITQETLKIDEIESDLDKSYNYLNEQISNYSSLVIGNSREVFQNIVELWDQRIALLNAIHQKIEKIHVDFRGDINRKYSEIAAKMKELFLSFEDVLVQHGRVVDFQI